MYMKNIITIQIIINTNLISHIRLHNFKKDIRWHQYAIKLLQFTDITNI